MAEYNEDQIQNIPIVETENESGNERINNERSFSGRNSISEEQGQRSRGNGSIVEKEPKSNEDFQPSEENLEENCCETMDTMQDTLRLCPGHHGKDGEPVIEFTPMGVYKNSKRAEKNICLAWFYDCLECCF